MTASEFALHKLEEKHKELLDKRNREFPTLDKPDDIIRFIEEEAESLNKLINACLEYGRLMIEKDKIALEFQKDVIKKIEDTTVSMVGIMNRPAPERQILPEGDLDE